MDKKENTPTHRCRYVERQEKKEKEKCLQRGKVCEAQVCDVASVMTAEEMSAPFFKHSPLQGIVKEKCVQHICRFSFSLRRVRVS